MKDYKASICILALNQLEFTQNCLNSLIGSVFPWSVEIILVDNGSNDGTAKWLEDFQNKYNCEDVRIVVILNKENRGCTGGRNQACKIAVGEYVIILDNDVETITDDWLVKMIRFYESQDNIGILGPKLLYSDHPNMIQQVGLGVTENGKIGYWGQGRHRDDPQFNKVRELQGYPAACWLLKRKIFEQHGYFDEIYYPVNLEDVDFCYRIRAAGYKIIYYPEVEMYHYEHATTKNTKDISFIRVTLKNGIVFKERWRHMFEKEKGMLLKDINWMK